MQNWNWFVLFRISLSLWKIKSFLSSDVCFRSDLPCAEKKETKGELCVWSDVPVQISISEKPPIFPPCVLPFHVAPILLAGADTYQHTGLAIHPAVLAFSHNHQIGLQTNWFFIFHAGLAIWPHLFAFQSSSHHPAQESNCQITFFPWSLWQGGTLELSHPAFH